ncbi:hypothetical protein BH23ACT12_BH23ACT12_14600 [soil metagenome]
MDPEEIENRQFLVQLRGYARDEVESFREEVAQEIKILRKQLTKATSDLSHANTQLGTAKAQLAQTAAQLEEERSRRAPDPQSQVSEAAPVEDRTAMFRMVGQETERILLAAEQAAEQIHDRAEKEAAELLADTRLRVERSLAKFDAARRAAEEDFAGIRDSRSMVASQLEDIRRRLEETISRLRVPVELPGSKPASRFRSQPEQLERGSQQPAPDRRQAESQAQQRQQREQEAAKELQARQTAHRQEADRRREELKAVQAEAEQGALAKAQRISREREAADSAAARKAQQAAGLQAAVAAAREADRLKAESAKAAEEASAAAARQAGKEAADKVKAEAERAAGDAVAAKELRNQEAEKAKAAEAAGDRGPNEQPPALPEESGSGGSSLDELLAEIRRKREEEERAAGTRQEPAAPVKASGNAVPEEIARRNDALGDLPAQTARRLKRLLQEEHNDLLDRLRTQRGKGDLDDNLAPHGEQLGRFVSGLTDALSRAFSEGSKAAGAAGDTSSTPMVTRLVTRQVLNPLRSEISKAIEAGLQAEDSAANLSERANDVFRVWKGVRTQLLGEGIAYAAYHQGMIDAWSSRNAAGKQWVFSSDEQDCPNDICRRNADGGAVALKAAFPSGHQAPPAHGGCTCTLQGS